jgi:glutamate decarboxylase
MVGDDDSILDQTDRHVRYPAPVISSEMAGTTMPLDRLGENPLEPGTVYETLREYLSIEGNATQNLATFCQTYMEPEATRLMSENLDKNAIDKDEYPMTADLEKRCVAIISDLWHAASSEEPMGTSTVGSSEACMLGGLALYLAWKKRAEAAGIDRHTTRPNIVISSGYQVCWEKFCRYWDIEMRAVPLDEDHLSLNLDTVMDYVDGYTIGIVAILGITYTGRYDDVVGLDRLVSAYNDAHPQMPLHIHVDAASGGMVAPFIEPELAWDFRCENVWSINTSGHKYGLVYPGVGWVVWRGRQALPEELVFWVSYLGGDEATMAINFSRSAAPIIGQYYVFMRNGSKGLHAIHQHTIDVARYMAAELASIGVFELLEAAQEIPIVCWRLRQDAGVQWTLYDLAERLRINGWLVPAYPLPADLEQVNVQRLVVRQDFSMPLAIKLMDDMKKEIAVLDKSRIIVDRGNGPQASGFDHSGRKIHPRNAAD